MSGLPLARESLNYGTATSSFRFGHPEFLKGLAGGAGRGMVGATSRLQETTVILFGDKI